MPPKGHSILSASSSDRWLHCPPSARLCETYEDKGSDYAAEGTDAHALCEYKLLKALGMEATDPTKSLDWYNAEMQTAILSSLVLRFTLESTVVPASVFTLSTALAIKASPVALTICRRFMMASLLAVRHLLNLTLQLITTMIFLTNGGSKLWRQS